ncbi:chorismate lyase, partial [Pseudomonadales bacterium]|nr:chorismate lyase [Pseudomonadales bacterium]
MSKHLDGNDALEANRSSILEIIDWQPAHGGILVQMPENLGPWLIDDGSLTRKLVALSKDQFEVQVLRQEVATPGAAEANALKMTQQTPVMIREV